jgi:hypothetical protein
LKRCTSFHEVDLRKGVCGGKDWPIHAGGA